MEKGEEIWVGKEGISNFDMVIVIVNFVETATECHNPLDFFSICGADTG